MGRGGKAIFCKPFVSHPEEEAHCQFFMPVFISVTSLPYFCANCHHSISFHRADSTDFTMATISWWGGDIIKTIRKISPKWGRVLPINRLIGDERLDGVTFNRNLEWGQIFSRF